MTMKHDTATSLRPVRSDDEELLYRIYASTRAEEMALVPWTDQQRAMFLRGQFTAQLQHYQSHYPEALHQMILLAGQPVGRLYVNRHEQEIRILDITILPEQRGRGIGTPLIRQLMNEAAITQRCVTIYIESFNRSRNLFERLGFKPIEENGFHWLFSWNHRDDQT